MTREMEPPPLLVPVRLRVALEQIEDARRFLARALAELRARSPALADPDVDDALAAAVAWLDAERLAAWSDWRQGRTSAGAAAERLEVAI